MLATAMRQANDAQLRYVLLKHDDFLSGVHPTAFRQAVAGIEARLEASGISPEQALQHFRKLDASITGIPPL